MNNETLKRDLCARLMEGVKCQRKNGEICTIIGLNGKPFKTNEKSFVYTYVKYQKYESLCNDLIEEIKPYLFSTSALTKPIQIASYNNGEPFVPVDEMAEIIDDLWFNDEYTREQFAYEYINGYVRLNPDTFEKINNFFNKVHINYRLSPDQFIEVTDEFNPYL